MERLLRWCGVLLCCVLWGAVPVVGLEKGPRQGVESLIERLADPQTSPDQRGAVQASLLEYGIHAIPVLVEHLQDTRIAGTSPSVSGACYNLPPRQPAPDGCGKSAPVTIGERCEATLYRLLTAGYQSPRAAMGKAGMTQPFVIRDWPGWWAQYRAQSLVQLQATARHLIDQFWQRGWEKGPVEWK